MRSIWITLILETLTSCSQGKCQYDMNNSKSEQQRLSSTSFHRSFHPCNALNYEVQQTSSTPRFPHPHRKRGFPVRLTHPTPCTQGDTKPSIIEILEGAGIPAYRSVAARLSECKIRYAPRCGIHQLCQRCASRRARRFARDIVSVAQKVEAEAARRIDAHVSKTTEIRATISGILESVDLKIPGVPRRDLTARKKRLNVQLTRLSTMVYALMVIRADGILQELKEAKKHLRSRGEIDPQLIRDRLKSTADLINRQINPCWKAVWLTMPSSGMGLSDQIAAVRETFSKFWRDYLTGACSAAFSVVEVSVGNGGKPHVHLNCVYFGQGLSPEHFFKRWLAFGGGPVIRCEDFRFSRDASITALTRYFLKYDRNLTPEFRVAFWEDVRGRQLVSRRGRFRKTNRRRQKKLDAD